MPSSSYAAMMTSGELCQEVRGGWEPDPSWQEVSGARGSATRGVWRAVQGEHPCIVKRLQRPPFRPGLAQLDRRHHSWWRREAEVARAGILAGSGGLIAPSPTRVVEDEDGISLWTPEIPAEPVADEVLANAYGRFASQEMTDPGWFNRGMLRHRVVATDRLGGAASLREEGVVSDSLRSQCEGVWRARYVILDALDRLPLVLSHGDALPRNMIRRERDQVVAVDWGQLGYNTVGADLATLALYSSVEIDSLVEAYVDGLTGVRRANKSMVRYATIHTVALIAVLRASRAVASKQDIDGYLGRLRKAEPVLAEVSR